MKYRKIIIKIFIINIMSFFISAHAIEWSKAPVACLPSRVEKWTDTANIPLCHCPPKNYCPATTDIKPSDIELIVEWHWSKGLTESGKLSGTDIPKIVDGTVKINDIFKYTSAQMKDLVYAPILEKFKIDTKTAVSSTKGYVKDTTVTTTLKPNSVLEGWINNTLKLPIDIATRCCESICPTGFNPNYINVNVVTPNGVMAEEYTMTKAEHDDYKTDFKYAYKKIFDFLYLWSSDYNASINSLSAFYQTQTSTANLENYLNIVKSFLITLKDKKIFFPINQYNLLINKFSALEITLQDELNRRNKPTTYMTVQTISCSVTTTYSREGCLHKGTKITMADGTFKTIEELKLGDEVKGNHGAAKIIALSKFTQKEDRMYSINGGKAFFTVEHPVLTPQGWKSIDSTITSVKSNAKIIGTLRVGDIILMDGGKQLKVTSIKEELMQGGIDAYNLSVTGDGSFIANGFIMKSFKQMQMHY